MNSFARILLIDDDIDQHNLLKVALPAFTELDSALNVQAAITLLQHNTYDLLIIDINLEDSDGFKLLDQMKKLSLGSDSIKIMLTASEREEDEIASHKYEVDDFIRKPIRPMVFSALIEKHLKKRVLSDVWIKGRIKIDITKMTIEGKNETGDYSEILATPKEFKILLKLIKNPGQVFSREQIFDGVWNEEDDSYLRSIDTHVSSLRRKIEPFGAKLSSVRGIGYKIELINLPG